MYLESLRERPVYIYTQGVPAPTGSGTKIRHFTNIRAYLDLGFDVEVIRFSECLRATPSQKPQLDGLDIKWTEVKSLPSRASLFQRFAYQLGFPFGPILNLSFRTRKEIRREVERREIKTPGAIHQFEYLGTASAVVGMDGINAIWSCYDLVSERHNKLFDFREEIGTLSKSNRAQRLRIRYLEQTEKAVASHCKLVLMIAKHECEFYRGKLGHAYIKLLPMSCPDESRLPRKRGWMEGGLLQLLHLGSVDGFIGYHSLKFLLEEVFPLMPRKVTAKLKMNVVGKIGDSEYSRQIQKLSSQYSQVRLLGYQEDVHPFYQTSDLQLVGSNVATGLRTRIIESFAYGLPVLSTYESAKGVVGLKQNENIFLADSALAFANKLIDITTHPESLPAVAEGGRRLYETYYSRSVAAGKLGKFLTEYL